MKSTYFLRIGFLASTGIIIAITSGALNCEAAATATIYQQTNLVFNVPGVAKHVDRLLVNPWGIAVFPDGRLCHYQQRQRVVYNL